jgi:methylmalonyl-CoA/ethylmalonyl-CoA epimerase
MTVDFDHIAFGLADAQPLIETLVRDLGATALFGQSTAGFRWVLLRAGDARRGMNVELLEPWRASEAPFLTRFLARRGGGAHHVTFKTDDLAALLTRLEAAGYEPVDVSLANPGWREAFLRPRDAHGTIVQVAESSRPRPSMHELLRAARADGAGSLLQYARGSGTAEVWWDQPGRRAATAVALGRVVLATRALGAASALFGELLGGRPVEEGERWVELEWPTGERIRLEEVAAVPAGIARLEGGPAIAPVPPDLAGVPLVLAG